MCLTLSCHAPCVFIGICTLEKKTHMQLAIHAFTVFDTSLVYFRCRRCIPARYQIVLLTFVAFFIIAAMRTSIAPAMVKVRDNDTVSGNHSAEVSRQSALTEGYLNACNDSLYYYSTVIISSCRELRKICSPC